MAETPTPNTGTPDHLILVLERIEDGRLVENAALALRELSQKMTRHATMSGGKPKGKLTIALNLTLADGVFDVVADVTVKEPKPVRPRSIMYAGKDGALVPNDPKQLTMDLQPPLRGMPETATRPRAV